MNIFPCAIYGTRSLLCTYFIYSSVCILISNSCFVPPAFPFGNHKFEKINHLIFILDAFLFSLTIGYLGSYHHCVWNVTLRSLLHLNFASWCLWYVNVAFESSNWRFCGMMLSIFPTCLMYLSLRAILWIRKVFLSLCFKLRNYWHSSKKKSCVPVDWTKSGGSGSVATSGQGHSQWPREQCLRGAWMGQSPRGIDVTQAGAE